MKFKDILALATAGYSMADIRELKAMADDKSDKPDEPDEPDEPDKPDKPDEPDEPDKPDDKLAAALSEIEKLKEDLKKAQEANTKQNIKDPDEKTPDEIVMEAFKGLL